MGTINLHKVTEPQNIAETRFTYRFEPKKLIEKEYCEDPNLYIGS